MAQYLLSLYSHQRVRNKNKTLLKRVLWSAGNYMYFWRMVYMEYSRVILLGLKRNYFCRLFFPLKRIRKQ